MFWEKTTGSSLSQLLKNMNISENPHLNSAHTTSVLETNRLGDFLIPFQPTFLKFCEYTANILSRVKEFVNYLMEQTCSSSGSLALLFLLSGMSFPRFQNLATVYTAPAIQGPPQPHLDTTPTLHPQLLHSLAHFITSPFEHFLTCHIIVQSFWSGQPLSLKCMLSVITGSGIWFSPACSGAIPWWANTNNNDLMSLILFLISQFPAFFPERKYANAEFTW